MKRALIHGTGIVQIVESGEDFDVAKPLFWADVADTTTVYDTYVDGAVVKFQAPDKTVRQVNDAISRALTAKINSGIEWAFAEGSDAYPIGLGHEMREVFGGFVRAIERKAKQPHKGVLATNKMIIRHPDPKKVISDAAIEELYIFGTLWIFKVSMKSILLKQSVYGMTTEQLNAFDPSAIDWRIKWGKDDYPEDLLNPNWLDNRIVREP